MLVPNGNFSGRFTSTGADQFIALPSGASWMMVFNETVSYAAGAGTGAQFMWSLGDTQGRGTVYTKTATTNALAVGQIAANSGFYLYNTSVTQFGSLTTLTAVSTATPPRVTVASTAGLTTGDVVTLYNVTGAGQLNGYDFTITVVDGTHFDLAYGPTIAVAATGGSWRTINNKYYFYPSTRDISKIESVGVLTRITMTVTQTYTIGQKVSLRVPGPVWGMTELNDLYATIVNIGQADANGVTNTIDVDIDSSSFTAFTFPAAGSANFSPAQVIPVGENTAEALTAGQNILAGATINTAQFGMLLKAGTSSPAGSTGDVITWIAGQSFNQ